MRVIRGRKHILRNSIGQIDELTGLYNRKAFVAMLDLIISKKKPTIIIAAALDEFKSINQVLGIVNGDLLLKEVASFFSANINGGEVFRIDGDCFAMILSCTRQDAEAEIKRVVKRFEEIWEFEGVEAMLSTGLCCIEYPNNAEKVEEIIYAIDYCTLEAKKGRKNAVVYADSDVLKYKERKNIVETAVKNAISKRNLDVYYQPIFSVAQQRYTSAEALVRLNDPKVGFILPEEFIPIAEKSGMIMQLGNVVFDKVCKFIGDNDLTGRGIDYIEINFSVIECMQENLAVVLKEIMKKYNVSPHCINLEITETDIANPSDTMVENMNELIELGISFSMDDYGTGYSNINQMIQFPFRIIKLDKGIVWSSSKSKKGEIVLKHTLAMLKELHFEIIAEGVETQEQAERLSKYGCDYLQGYYYSVPASENTFLELLKM